MRLLLDTHAIIWWLEQNPRLPADTSEIINNRSNESWLSVASVWEIAIKSAQGKLQTPSDLAQQMAANDIRPLTITMTHAHETSALPLHHRDPFDRMLVAQARCENLTLITHDRRIRNYDVRLLMI